MTIVSILYFSLCRYPGAGLSLSMPAGCIGCIRQNVKSLSTTMSTAKNLYWQKWLLSVMRDTKPWPKFGRAFFKEIWPLEPALQSAQSVNDFAGVPSRVGVHSHRCD